MNSETPPPPSSIEREDTTSWALLALPLGSLLFVTFYWEVPVIGILTGLSVLLTVGTALIEKLYPKKTIATALPILFSVIILILGFQSRPKPGLTSAVQETQLKESGTQPEDTMAILTSLTNVINKCLNEKNLDCRNSILEQFKIESQAEVLIERPRNKHQSIPGGFEVFLASTSDILEIKSVQVIAIRKNALGLINQITLLTKD